MNPPPLHQVPLPAVELLAVLTALAVLTTAGGLALHRRVRRWRHTQLLDGAQQVLITPPAQVDPDGARACWTNLHGLLTPGRWRRLRQGTPHLALEYRWTGRHLQILIWVPGTMPAGPIAAAVSAAWPGATTVIEPATHPVPLATRPCDRASTEPEPSISVDGGALVLARPDWHPLATDHDTDPYRALLGATSTLNATETACVQVLARPATPRQLARLRAGAAALKAGRSTSTGLPERVLTSLIGALTAMLSSTRTSAPTGTRPVGDPHRDRDATAALTKTTTGPHWETAIRYGVTHATARPSRAMHLTRKASRLTWRRRLTHRELDAATRRLITVCHALASAFAVHTAGNRLRPIPAAHPDQLLASRQMRRGFLLTTTELAAVAGLPTDLAVPGLDRARARTVPAPITVPTGGRNTKVLGRAAVGGHTVALPVADARHHLHVIGSTGVGKSTLLAQLVLGDIRAGRGVVLIDPKGDLALDVLARLPEDIGDRLVLIDPDQPDRSATFNPLQRRGTDDDLVVDNIVSIFAAIFQRHWGPRIDDVMRVACLTVMRHPRPTLTTVPPLLNDKQFRAPFTAGLDDPEGLKGFWEWFEATPPALRAQITGPVLARLRSFLLRDFVRATIGPHESSFDMTRILDHGGVLIARLPKGQLGEDTSRLLGSLVFASVWQAATHRARQPEPRRRDATVVIDEAHNILNLAGSVNDMLAEARGYRLSLVLAHQHLAQLPRDTQLAISANARNKIYFTCSPEDAHQLARHTTPELDEHDLTHLDAYTAAALVVVATARPPPSRS